MTPADDDTPLDGGKEAEAAFGSGFPDQAVEKPADKAAPADKPTAKPDKPEPAATPRVEATPEPEKFVQISEKEWADVKAAAARTASYDSQFSKLFGTTGSIQKLLNDQRAKEGAQSTPAAARKFEIPKESFAQMARDFPELAEQTRAAMEAALSGLPGPGGDAQDPAKLESLIAARETKRELAILAARHSDWRDIVGVVDSSTGQPPPETPFRKWLATKDQAYQDTVNSSELADVIGRSIRTFQRETAAPAKPAATPRDTARAERIRDAITPRGDNQGAAPRNTAEEAFQSGFSGR